MRTQRTDGTLVNLVFCDVFEMQDGKIRRLISYLMETPYRSAQSGYGLIGVPSHQFLSGGSL